MTVPRYARPITTNITTFFNMKNKLSVQMYISAYNILPQNHMLSPAYHAEMYNPHITTLFPSKPIFYILSKIFVFFLFVFPIILLFFFLINIFLLLVILQTYLFF